MVKNLGSCFPQICCVLKKTSKLTTTCWELSASQSSSWKHEPPRPAAQDGRHLGPKRPATKRRYTWMSNSFVTHAASLAVGPLESPTRSFSGVHVWSDASPVTTTSTIFPSGEAKRLLEPSSGVFTTLAFYFRLATFPRCCSSRSGGACSVSSCGCLEAAALWGYWQLWSLSSSLRGNARSASSHEGSLLSSEHLVYRSRVCRLTREWQDGMFDRSRSTRPSGKGVRGDASERESLKWSLFVACKSGQSKKASRAAAARGIAAQQWRGATWRTAKQLRCTVPTLARILVRDWEETSRSDQNQLRCCHTAPAAASGLRLS